MTQVIDVDDPDHQLAWPREIIAAELDRRLRLADTPGGGSERWSEGLSRLLRLAFTGPGLAEEFDALGDSFGFTPDASQVSWVRALREQLDEARPAPSERPYWSQRHGAASEVLDLVATAERFVGLIVRLDRDGLFSQFFGVGCPDGVGDPAEPPAQQITDRIGRTPPGLDGWPPHPGLVTQWTRDDLFDLIEVFHDLASWPGRWSGHDYGGCVGHPGDFSPTLGRALYRHEANKLLARSNLGVRLANSGEDVGRIVMDAGPGLDERVQDALAASPPEHWDDVSHAVALFRSRTRDVATMRSAIIALAGVVEHHRWLLKQELLSGDEGALFEIANKFGLRHRNADQRTDYDPAFLEWLFHWYLSTVALIGRLTARQEEAGD